ncbi:CBO0543 family protein [Cohnella caldifontis]|uniref:CBO0543 family protein n=1 Tax=Cohnella caldifontis TaxID=3027471 RepID=UPI0023EDA446|nr:CBO0543 family protein [Cohnella sp. YIM B05605]
MERMILISMWGIGIVGFILFVPRKNRREGSLAALIFQSMIWGCDFPAFKYGLLSAPVREFPEASDLAITINYFFYPVIFSIFYVHLRLKRSLWSKFSSFFLWVSALTLLDITLEKYTDLLQYGLLTWYGMWIYIGFLFFISLVCCNWFLKKSGVGTNEY